MKIIALNEEISQYEIDHLPKAIDVFIYSYAYGCYEGSGNALFRMQGLWYLHSMGHCSCYGPMENIDSCGVGKKLKDIQMSNEYREETKSLFDRARKFK